jgi:DNA replication protein DnaC
MAMIPVEAEVTALCHTLKLPAVGRDAVRLANEACRQGTAHLNYLVQLLEIEHRERDARRTARGLKEAGFPLVKTLEGFDFKRAPHLSEVRIRELAVGHYINQAESIILLGEPGTGKTHLATALGVAATQQGRSVRFVTAARLATELTEARDAHELGRIAGRYSRVEVLVLDELGYVPLGRTDAELLFQVLSERQERRPVIVTTNLPFGEWTSVFSDARLCRAVVDRLTHRAHIIETGSQSIRLAETLARSRPGANSRGQRSEGMSRNPA